MGWTTGIYRRDLTGVVTASVVTTGVVTTGVVTTSVVTASVVTASVVTASVVTASVVGSVNLPLHLSRVCLIRVSLRTTSWVVT